MSHYYYKIAAGVAAVLIQAFPGVATAATSSDTAKLPAKVELVAGTTLKRVTLTPKAAERLDIQTGQITEDETGRKIAPYTSLFYDLAGETWVYTSPEALSFVRQKVVVESIKGGNVYLKDGPAKGEKVVTVGVSELFGTEKGGGK